MGLNRLAVAMIVALAVVAMAAPVLSLRSRPSSSTLLEVEADTAAAMESTNNARLAAAADAAADAAVDAATATETETETERAGGNFFAHKQDQHGRRMYGHKKADAGFRMFAHAESKQGHYAHYKPGTLQYRHAKHGGNMEKFVAENGFLPDKNTARKLRKQEGKKTEPQGDAKNKNKNGAAGAARPKKAAGVTGHAPPNPRAAAAAAAIARMNQRAAGAAPGAAAAAAPLDPAAAAALAVQQIRPEFQNDWVTPQDIHVHVKTVAHGGAGLDNLVRIENKFDETHSGLMHSLNRLMFRISKFQEAEEAKKPFKELQRKKRRAAALEAIRLGKNKSNKDDKKKA